MDFNPQHQQGKNQRKNKRNLYNSVPMQSREKGDKPSLPRLIAGTQQSGLQQGRAFDHPQCQEARFHGQGCISVQEHVVQEHVQHSCTCRGPQWLPTEQCPTSTIHMPCQEHHQLKLLQHQQSPSHISDVALSRHLLPIKHKHTPVWHPIQATTQPKLTALSAKS